MYAMNKWDVSPTNDLIPRIILDFEAQNFDILSGYDNEPVIAFHLSSTICEDGSLSHIETDGRGIEVLNGLCQQVRNSRRISFIHCC
jgi:hypothetical protein